MTSERIKEIQGQTAYPESVSVYQALLQVWNECHQEHNKQLAINGDDNQIRKLLYAVCDELDVVKNQQTPPTLKSLVVNKILSKI